MALLEVTLPGLEVQIYIYLIRTIANFKASSKGETRHDLDLGTGCNIPDWANRDSVSALSVGLYQPYHKY